MYILQEKVGTYWHDLFENDDEDTIFSFRDAFRKKYPYKLFRVVEVTIHV